jgi:hypothetical protein
MRVVAGVAVAAAVLCLAGCATDRYRWSLAHAYISPRAGQLPRAELEEIVWLAHGAIPLSPWVLRAAKARSDACSRQIYRL